jgi:osmotically-inducible protein OsmY
MTLNHAIRGLLGAALMLGGAGVALADTDGRLEEKVETRLKEDTRFEKLDVDVQEGVVTLRGEVASSAQKLRAEKLARAAGAKKVINDLEIDPDKAVAQIKDAAEAKKQRIDEQAERQKEAVDRRAEAAAERAATGVPGHTSTDRAPAVVVERRKPDPVVVEPSITARVKTGLEGSEALTGSEINVDTGPDGVVTLTGTVPSSTAEARAIEIARTTVGVRKVVDHLDVKNPEIAAKVKHRFHDDEVLAKSEIEVQTLPDGVVTLKGTVPSTLAEARALEVARTTDGVRKVVDEIDVKEPGTTLKVKSQFNKDETLARSQIDVHTDSDGVVTLRGTVPSAAAEARAIEIARSMAGVTKVVDKIDVGAPVVR